MRPVRERTEELERASLSTWATLAAESKGRDRHEEPDPLRTAFQRDRDRILHTSAFRQLKDKTQAFVRGGEHNRVRLTHTLEVAQIARSVARALRLNEDLVEAIALGHDLGHTPFGSAGEEALSAFCDAPFRHEQQSLRLVERLAGDGRGLNLTWEVRDGILHHGWDGPAPATCEGQVVRLADRAAGAIHDLDDAQRAGLLTADDLLGELRAGLGTTRGQQVATFVADVTEASFDEPEVRMSQRVTAYVQQLHDLLGERVHRRPEARADGDRALHCLRSLAVWYLDNPGALPAAFRQGAEPLAVRVCDYVAGMTDGAVLAEFSRLFLPDD